MSRFSILCFILFGISTLSAQKSEAPTLTESYFIENINIISKPGTILSKTNMLIKGGLIAEIGPMVKQPFDAKNIKGDSMFAYSAFIAPYSHIGQKEAEKGKDDKQSKPSSPGQANFDQAGITPQLKASDNLDYKDKSISSYREQGFAIAHSVPEGFILKGQGSVISLKEASDNGSMILMKDISQAAELKTKRGVFPSTTIGAMSRLREVFKNADTYASNTKNYNVNPVGMARPDYNPVYDAFGNVVKRSTPMFFEASKVKDVHRVLTLQKELGFGLVLSNVKYISPILGRINLSTPILLSLDLPKEIKDKKKDKDKKEEDKKQGEEEAEQAEAAEEEKDEMSDERKELEEKKKAMYTQYLSQAKILSEKGYQFSFAYNNIKSSDIHKNIRRMVEAGLSKDKALEALTITPAKLLKVENIAGTVEIGKLANIVIFDRDMFDKDAKIKYIFVEGQITENKEEKKNKKSKGKLGFIEGTWRYNADVMGQVEYGKMYLTKINDGYRIDVESDDEPGDADQAYDVQLDGRDLSFKIDVPADGNTLTVTMALTFESDTVLKGTGSIPGVGSFPFNAEKTDKPD